MPRDHLLQSKQQSRKAVIPYRKHGYKWSSRIDCTMNSCALIPWET